MAKMNALKNKVKELKEQFLYYPLIIITTIVIIDQLTKYLTFQAQPNHPEIIKVVKENFFHLVHYRNKGAAWGIFDEYTFILALISLAAFIYIIYNFKQLTEEKKSLKIIFSLLAGGILGNWIDRQFYQDGVIDMFEFFIPLPKFISQTSYRYPAFNIADACIFIAMCFFIFNLFFIKKTRKIKK